MSQFLPEAIAVWHASTAGHKEKSCAAVHWNLDAFRQSHVMADNVPIVRVLCVSRVCL